MVAPLAQNNSVFFVGSYLFRRRPSKASPEQARLVEPVKVPCEDTLTHGGRSPLGTLRAGRERVRTADLAGGRRRRARATLDGRRVWWDVVALAHRRPSRDSWRLCQEAIKLAMELSEER